MVATHWKPSSSLPSNPPFERLDAHRFLMCCRHSVFSSVWLFVDGMHRVRFRVN